MVKRREWEGQKQTKEHKKKKRVRRLGSEAAAEMRWGGGAGGGRLDVCVGGVLARAAALGDCHLRLLLQFDVDHWGSFVKHLYLWICAFRDVFSASSSVVTVTRYQQEHSVPMTKLRCDSFMKRILSSLLFSGVLSIPGNAAATRRNSWKQIRGAWVHVSLGHTKAWMGHHLSS